jgi:hypothetical protein
MRKYRNKKITIDGIVFDSLAEGKRYEELKLMKHANNPKDKVVSIDCHPRYDIYLGNKYIAHYKADFKVRYEDGREEIEDVKGIKTSTYRLKKKLVEAIYGIKIIEI